MCAIDRRALRILLPVDLDAIRRQATVGGCFSHMWQVAAVIVRADSMRESLADSRHVRATAQCPDAANEASSFSDRCCIEATQGTGFPAAEGHFRVGASVASNLTYS